MIGWGQKQDGHNQGTLGSGKPCYGPLRSQGSFLLIEMNRGLCKIPQVLPKPTLLPQHTHIHTHTYTHYPGDLYLQALTPWRKAREVPGRGLPQPSTGEHDGACLTHLPGLGLPERCPQLSAREGWQWGPYTPVPQGLGWAGASQVGGGDQGGRSPGDTAHGEGECSLSLSWGHGGSEKKYFPQFLSGAPRGGKRMYVLRLHFP